MKECNVFKGYEEGNPLFDPTYRYDVGTDNYDTRFVEIFVQTSFSQKSELLNSIKNCIIV